MLKEQSELFYIDAKLRQINKCNDLQFVVVTTLTTIVLAGYYRQLLPVKGKCLWSRKSKAQNNDRSRYLVTIGVLQLEQINVLHLDPNNHDEDAVFFTFFYKPL